jgi:hypothetical protein
MYRPDAFVGNNRLQLQQFGAEPEDTIAGTPGDGSMAALMLRPIGTLSMLKLMLHGAMGRLGEAAGVESFEFKHMVVKPTLCTDHTELVVAFDGEVARMRAPIDIRVLESPCTCFKPLVKLARRARHRLLHECPAADFRHPFRH